MNGRNSAKNVQIDPTAPFVIQGWRGGSEVVIDPNLANFFVNKGDLRNAIIGNGIQFGGFRGLFGGLRCLGEAGGDDNKHERGRQSPGGD